MFQLDLPDAAALRDPKLATKAGDHPKLVLTLSFTDELGTLARFDRQVGVECAFGPNFDHAYFCGGSCAGLYSTYQERDISNCGGCGLACSYKDPAGVQHGGKCATYNKAGFGGYVDSCGVYVQAPTQNGGPDLTKSCDAICAQYSGRGKPGTCVERCWVGNWFSDGGFGESLGSRLGFVGAAYTGQIQRGGSLLTGRDQVRT